MIAVGLILVIKSKSKQQPEATTVADKKDWTLTGRMDFAASDAPAGLVLEVEETWTSLSPSGVEHRGLRWRRATLPEAKTIVEFYHAQRNLGLSPSFTLTGSAEAKRNGDVQGESLDAEHLVSGPDMADATLVPKDVTH